MLYQRERRKDPNTNIESVQILQLETAGYLSTAKSTKHVHFQARHRTGISEIDNIPTYPLMMSRPMPGRMLGLFNTPLRNEWETINVVDMQDPPIPCPVYINIKSREHQGILMGASRMQAMFTRTGPLRKTVLDRMYRIQQKKVPCPTPTFLTIGIASNTEREVPDLSEMYFDINTNIATAGVSLLCWIPSEENTSD